MELDVIIDVVTCDNCRVDFLDKNVKPVSKQVEAKRKGDTKYTKKEFIDIPVGFKLQGKLAERGLFNGNAPDALAAGWEERDFGVVCPACVADEKAQEQRDVEDQVGPDSPFGSAGLEGMADTSASTESHVDNDIVTAVGEAVKQKSVALLEKAGEINGYGPIWALERFRDIYPLIEIPAELQQYVASPEVQAAQQERAVQAVEALAELVAGKEEEKKDV
jgi:hypothetical protein